MPHNRKRHVLRLVKKKLSFSPIVTIQGPRQSGKSFFARELLQKTVTNSKYYTLDLSADREFANTNPDSFLATKSEYEPLIIDEVQKAPALFDALKYQVDQDRRPGRYLILGSTEFSRELRIKETLTGRISRTRMFPMTMAEAFEKDLNPSKSWLLINEKPRFERADFLKHLERGGMPAIFHVRSDFERNLLFKDWLNTVCFRDLGQFSVVKVDGELAYSILEKIATLDAPTAGNIAKVLKKDLRRINTHLNLLKILFAIDEIAPHGQSSGKPQYFLCDSGIANFFGAKFERLIQTSILTEFRSQLECLGDVQMKISFYRSPKGKLIHFVLENQKNFAFIQIFPEEKYDKRMLNLLATIKEKEKSTLKKIQLIGLWARRESIKDLGIELYPWESMC
jgi:predicted AAA+ superfamily ATPase